jgi:hypothetical protein
MTTAKKQPVRVFLDQTDHSRFLVQAGTHRLTPSALGERLMQYGLAQLERGDLTPLEGATTPARPEPGR